MEDAVIESFNGRFRDEVYTRMGWSRCRYASIFMLLEQWMVQRCSSLSHHVDI
ncbi:MAG: hypothetical protein KF722_07780 [Nitrospira sp.]|nr:hypothetical protein [Nitrospira sp.]